MNKTSSSYAVSGSISSYYTSSYVVTGESFRGPIGVSGYHMSSESLFTYQDPPQRTYKDPTQDPINLKPFEEAIENLEKIRTKKRILKNSLEKGFNFFSVLTETFLNAR